MISHSDSDAYLFNVPPLDLFPASYLFVRAPFAAEQGSHGVNVAAVIWSTGGFGTAESEYGVEGFISVCTIEQILLNSSMHYRPTHR